MTQPIPKPLPQPDAASRPFYDGAAEGRLMLMKCSECGDYRLPARAHCPRCLSDRSTWEAAGGRGTIRTFGVMHRRYHPGFEVPYNVTIVELDEGPRLPTNIIGVANEQLGVGMRVEVEWERHEDVTLPKFRPIASERS